MLMTDSHRYKGGWPAENSTYPYCVFADYAGGAIRQIDIKKFERSEISNDHPADAHSLAPTFFCWRAAGNP
jgi:hypothetical protein